MPTSIGRFYPPRVVAAPRALRSLDADSIAELVARAPRIGAAAEATRRLAAACPAILLWSSGLRARHYWPRKLQAPRDRSQPTPPP